MKTLLLPIALLLASASIARADDSKPVVHVDASSATVLERVDHGRAEPVCNAPCDRPVDPDAKYVVNGEGVRASNSFRIPEDSRVFRVDVKPASSGGFTAGVVLTTIGGVFMAGALAFLGGAAASTSSADLGLEVFSFIGAISCGTVSLATGIPGMVMLFSNIQSRARVFEGDRLAGSTPAPLPRGPAFAVPLLHGSF